MRQFRVLCAAAAVVSVSVCHAGMTFNLTDGTDLANLKNSNPTLYNQVKGGFVAAANLWSAKLSNNVTVNITVNYAALGAGILGQNQGVDNVYSYSQVKSGLQSHATSTLDATAINNLPAGSTLRFYTNNTTNSPSSRYLDAGSANWNQYLAIPAANAKVLGLHAANDTASDGAITFSNAFTWDFAHSKSMSGSAIDFVGVAAHELGHALGFTSGVDVVDQYSYPNGPDKGTSLVNYAIFSTLDLYRHKKDAGSILDLSTGSNPSDGSAPYLSADGGVTSLGALSTGSYNGTDNPKYQASHWQESTGWLMKPALAYGQLADISNADLQALDIIGYTLVPEPGVLMLLVASSTTLLLRKRAKAA